MRNKQKKITGTAAAVILVLVLGLAGTFAASGSTNSTGNIEDTVDTSIVLHDDFSKTWEDTVMNRDVYVENSGKSSLYVRMRLDEFMTYGGKYLAGIGGTADNTDKWKPHIPFGTQVSECDTEVHDYFTLQMGNNAGVKYKPGVVNACKEGVADADKTETTSAAKVVLMKDYITAEEKPDPCWVLDDQDGYAYWYTRLNSEEATGLILNSISSTGLIDESYYYGINAKAEAVTETDLNSWFNGQPPKSSTTGIAFDRASANAIRLLKNISPKYIKITQEMKDNGASDYDSDNDGYLTKQENTAYEADKGMTSSPDPGPGTVLNDVQKKVKAASVGETVAIDNSVNTYGTSTDWLVLSKNENEAVLITDKLVTVRPFNKNSTEPIWPASDIRAWLNSGISGSGDSYAGNGYIDTFGADMKQALKEENLKTAVAFNNWSTMASSADKVYLLTETWESSGKVGKNPDQAAAESLMTTEQLKRPDTTLDGTTGGGATCWWLRSPRYDAPGRGRIMNETGTFDCAGSSGALGIRPAVTVILK